MQQYLDLVRHILTTGLRKGDRTGTGTFSVFGAQMRFDLKTGFPLLTTKKVHLKSIIHELLWFLQGSTNIQYLKENGVSIWDEWADSEGNLGPVYGKQWRDWVGPNGEHIDQIENVIRRLKTHPDCRRLIVTAWQPAEVVKMALPPCHCFFQFWTRELTGKERRIWLHANNPDLLNDIDKAIEQQVGAGGFKVTDTAGVLDEDASCQRLIDYLTNCFDQGGVPRRGLSCQLYMRSVDTFLGMPFNIASYALLTMMIAQVTNMVPDEFILTGGDAHLYTNHLEQVDLQLSREPRALPTMRLNPDVKDIFDFKYEDFTLEGYNPHPAIKAPVAV